jgi:hypothetical protein
VIFRIFKIAVYQWSLTTSALGDIIGIALLLESQDSEAIIDGGPGPKSAPGSPLARTSTA